MMACRSVTRTGDSPEKDVRPKTGDCRLWESGLGVAKTLEAGEPELSAPSSLKEDLGDSGSRLVSRFPELDFARFSCLSLWRIQRSCRTNVRAHPG